MVAKILFFSEMSYNNLFYPVFDIKYELLYCLKEDSNFILSILTSVGVG